MYDKRNIFLQVTTQRTSIRAGRKRLPQGSSGAVVAVCLLGFSLELFTKRNGGVPSAVSQLTMMGLCFLWCSLKGDGL